MQLAGVVGHSQGEIAAACVAGVLSLEEGARVVVGRSRALVGLVGAGGMVSAALSAEEAFGCVGRWEGVELAAVNGPGSVVFSGEPEALEGLLGELERGGVRAREIPVGYAAHSEQVQGVEGELLGACEGLEPKQGGVPFYSSVTGGVLDGGVLDGGYWYRNLRERVDFQAATRAALERGSRVFIEMGPHPVLGLPITQTAEQALQHNTPTPRSTENTRGSENPENNNAGGPENTHSHSQAEQVLVLGSLRREEGDLKRFLCSLSEYWVAGGHVDWRALYQHTNTKPARLPTYAFQRQRYWLQDTNTPGDLTHAGLTTTEHPLLSSVLRLAGGAGYVFSGLVSLESEPWLADHLVMGSVLMPGAALLEMALYAAGRLGARGVAELVLQAPLVLPEQHAVRLQVTVSDPDESGASQIEIYSSLQSTTMDEEGDGEWTLHATGSLEHEHERPGETPVGSDSLTQPGPPADARALNIESLYEDLAARGLEYGPAFQCVTAAWETTQNTIIADIQHPQTQTTPNHNNTHTYTIHPTLLDAALHTTQLHNNTNTKHELPFAWRGVSVSAGAHSLRVEIATDGQGDVSLMGVDGRGAFVAVQSLSTREVSAQEIARAGAGGQDSLFSMEWLERPSARGAARGGWAVVGDGARESVGRSAVAERRLVGYCDLDELEEALAEGAPAPEVVLLACTAIEGVLPRWIAGDPEVLGLDGSGAGEEEAGALGVEVVTRAFVLGVFGVLRRWLSEERFAHSRLMLATREAVAVGAGEQLLNLVQAPLWGLLRSAQAEHPGRFALVDVDAEAQSWEALLGLESEEAQLAIRKGAVLVPQLSRVAAPGILRWRWRRRGGGRRRGRRRLGAGGGWHGPDHRWGGISGCGCGPSSDRAARCPSSAAREPPRAGGCGRA